MAHETKSFPCPFTSKRYLVVKHYDDGHYYSNIYYCGRGYDRPFVRTSLRWLKLIGVM